MAPRFKRNMFWCWEYKEKSVGLLGFASSKDLKIFEFRDKLTAYLSQSKTLFVNKQEGEPTKSDSMIRLFDLKDEERVQDFLNKKVPNFFQSFFRTKYYQGWEDEWATTMNLAKVTLETSHDFPCLIIYSHIHSPKELFDLINRASDELGVKLYENERLKDINEILMSNQTFS